MLRMILDYQIRVGYTHETYEFKQFRADSSNYLVSTNDKALSLYFIVFAADILCLD